MKKKKRCIICDKARDPETGLCPTPAACDKLKSPAKRLRSEASATAARVRAARAESESLGVSHVRSLRMPDDRGTQRRVGETQREAAQRRARTGWRTRRAAGG